MTDQPTERHDQVADPRQPVITNPTDAAQALADWIVNAPPDQVQAMVEARGDWAREARQSGELPDVVQPRTWKRWGEADDPFPA